MSVGSFPRGIPSIASAMMGLPPIAQTSETAFAAAIRPKSAGSSTTGMKKSVVAITHVFLSICHELRHRR